MIVSIDMLLQISSKVRTKANHNFVLMIVSIDIAVANIIKSKN